ncbi:gliding motility-associated C-terminal domain-containing protein [Paracrocinitomix mangrovi]|uniref:gliding motility-associated C-terminal domain-containing protein n=1 Tax=Paracrocinitomix mangrovi TaxID=2862509 RepID=UPI001EDA5676|nr:gliding motility-associated C-terminal domain-containing protein [Paracrocinitomix mangrovi]UKN00529.1 gliding motility-associated C-terminal domain-containing protein [Paracrocinitomix mangrovi]
MKTLILLTFLASSHAFSQGGGEQNVVEIPNIFTPNGDGINDIFKINAVGFEELTCNIYNRQGELVYRFEGLNGSWDGHTHAGVKVSPGTYFVIVEIRVGEEVRTDQETLQVQY